MKFLVQCHPHDDFVSTNIEELATNKIVFNKIVDPCPHCGIEIPCSAIHMMIL